MLVKADFTYPPVQVSSGYEILGEDEALLAVDVVDDDWTRFLMEF